MDKGPVYSQSKTERKLIGPAAYKYFDTPDRYYSEGELKDDNWNWVEIPHDYVVTQDNSKEENCALGFLRYENMIKKMLLQFMLMRKNLKVGGIRVQVFIGMCISKSPSPFV